MKLSICNFLGDIPVPIGRGSVRGQRSVEIVHFRAPRPQSSLGTTGKQGTAYFKLLCYLLIYYSCNGEVICHHIPYIIYLIFFNIIIPYIFGV